MRHLLLILLLAVTACAQDKRAFTASEAALLGGAAADTITTYRVSGPGVREANPLGLNGGTALKLGGTGALLIVEHLAMRHNPRIRRWATVLNFCLAGEFGYAAWHNEGLR